MDELTEDMIERWFTYHASTPEQRPHYAELRRRAKDFAIVIGENTPASAEQTVALRRLHEAYMYACAAIACNPGLISQIPNDSTH